MTKKRVLLATLLLGCCVTAPAFANPNAPPPPPKEWAEFPKDTPPAPPPAGAQTATPPTTGNAPAPAATPGGNVEYAAVTSAPRLAAPVEAREINLFWLLVTTVLSLATLALGGILIYHKESATLESLGT